ATWRQLSLSNPYLFAVAPGDSRVLYAWENVIPLVGLKRSGDGGATWQEVHAPPPFDETYLSLAVDVRDPNTIYLGPERRIFRSRDGGRTLEVLDPDFSSVLMTDRARPGFLFARGLRGGIFELPVE